MLSLAFRAAMVALQASNAQLGAGGVSGTSAETIEEIRERSSGLGLAPAPGLHLAPPLKIMAKACGPSDQSKNAPRSPNFVGIPWTWYRSISKWGRRWPKSGFWSHLKNGGKRARKMGKWPGKRKNVPKMVRKWSFRRFFPFSGPCFPHFSGHGQNPFFGPKWSTGFQKFWGIF